MTDSFRREGEYPQESPTQHAPFGEDWQRGRDRLAQDAAGAYPPPPSYPPAAPGWHEAHQPPVIQGETVPAGPAGQGGHAGGPPTGPAHAATPAPRARRPVALLAAVALAAAVVGGGTAAAVQQLMGPQQGTGGGVNGTNVSQSSTGTVSGVAEQVSPSVVRIDTGTASGQGTGTGSGIVLTADGEIVTNNHVVNGATRIQVTTSDGKKYSAKIVGTDPDKDLALIKLQDASGLKPAELGDSGSLKVGEQVVAIGSPDRLTGTVTSGIVSALEREVNVPKSEQQSPQRQQQGGGWPFSYGGQQFNGNTGSDTTSYKAIQTDASLNPGNSGGALVNMNGEIVGMPSAIYSPSSSAEGAGSVGLGFAIPVNTIKADLDSLRKGGSGGAGSADGNGTGTGTADGFGTSY
ncbi:S1C family serine protease [Streptomyces sp. NBC_01408]|uniref:S1C family serine protease n=1 Tax=Streptomyces sp. NBC_01408 TaxID=2903855 RepID=UPI00225667DA|nr:trypsin-like peptidase domain-containing protein [Streptomyces sp. NBC_01408]MCX4691952.1 trypsin-like peptidase domain-containing protein [Streptomyces sp. NBC_01408]